MTRNKATNRPKHRNFKTSLLSAIFKNTQDMTLTKNLIALNVLSENFPINDNNHFVMGQSNVFTLLTYQVCVCRRFAYASVGL